MSSIKKRPNGTWRARYRDESGREHARHFDRKTDAARWLDQVTASVVTGSYVDPRAGGVTFHDWFASWSGRQVWAPGTLLAAQQAAGSLTFGTVPLGKIKPSHVEQWIKAMSLPAASRRTGLAPSTIKTRYNYVHMAFRAAVKDRVIPLDPSAGLSLPKIRRADAAMTIPTADDVGAALELAPGDFRAFVAVCAFAGLRLGEAAALRVGDVDFLRRSITVHRQVQGQTNTTAEVVPPKHGSERTVYIPKPWRRSCPNTSAPSGCTVRNGAYSGWRTTPCSGTRRATCGVGPGRQPGSVSSRCTTCGTSSRRASSRTAATWSRSSTRSATRTRPRRFASTPTCGPRPKTAPGRQQRA